MSGRSARRGTVIAIALVATALMSTSPVDVAAADRPPSIKLAGGGFGHGVGMGQYGAEGMARNGRTATEILKHYYSGVDVVRRDLRAVSVLIGAGRSSVEVTTRGTSKLRIAIPGRRNPNPRQLGPGDTVRAGTDGTHLYVKLRRAGRSDFALIGTYRSGSRARIKVPRARVAVRPDTPSQFLGWVTGETSRDYRYGVVQLVADAGGAGSLCNGNLCTILGRMRMQQYLRGLAEVPGSFALNAQKAQAVAGRSFAAIRRKSPREPGLYHLRADVYDQYYKGWAHQAGNRAWNRAVTETDGYVMVYDGSVVQGFYSSSTGGYTESSAYVWTSQPGYLKPVRDPGDAVSVNPRHRWAAWYTFQEISAWFGVRRIRDVKIVGDVGTSGRVDKATVRIIGRWRTKDVPGITFKNTINARAGYERQLWSTKFRVAEVRR